MPLTTAQQAALDRLKSFYEGDNPYNSVTNPGGFRQNGHLYNFVPALKDIATVTTGLVALAAEVATNSVQSPKAIRVDADQNYTDGEKAQGQKNLGIAATLAAAVSKAGDVMTGILRLNAGILQIAKIGAVTTGMLGHRLLSYSDDKFYIQSLDGSITMLNIGQDGSLSTPQLGDLNTRIEARAAAFAALRVAKTGDTMTGTLVAPNFNTTKGSPGSAFGILSREAGGKDFQLYNSQNLVRFWETAAGDFVRFGPDGSVWTLQLGDLNQRIEARAKAFADIAQATAQGTSVNKTGDTMTGQLVVQGAPLVVSSSNPQLDIVWGNVIRVRQTINASGQWKLQNGDSADDLLIVTPSTGAVWVKQFGDLNARIEARGAAYGALAVQKTGDVMSGDLQINGSTGGAGFGVRFIFPSNADWLIRGTAGNLLQFCDGARTVQYFSLGTDGSINTKQFGGLNARIEARAKAFADVAQSAAYNAAVAACQQSTRLVYAGDLGNSWNLGGGYTEPYPGAVMTTRYTYTESDGTWNFGGARWRYLQMYVPNAGGWVTAGYA